MNTYQKRTLQAFRRIQGWLAAHPELGALQQSRLQLVTTGAGSQSNTSSTTSSSTAATGNITVAAVAEQSAALNAVVDELTVTAGEQEAQDRAARGAAADIVRLRDELVRHQMRHIAIIAESAIPDVVRMTAALRRPGYKDAEGIIASADAMAQAAVQYKGILIQRGLPADFVEQLQAATAAFKGAVDARGASVGQRHHAREAVNDVMLRGKSVVHTLEVLVARRYRGDNATLAAWKQVKHVVRVGVRVAPDESAATTVRSAQQPSGQPVQSAAA